MLKSSTRPDIQDAKKLEAFLDDFPDAQACLISRTERREQIGKVLALPWKEGLEIIFSG